MKNNDFLKPSFLLLFLLMTVISVSAQEKRASKWQLFNKTNLSFNAGLYHERILTPSEDYGVIIRPKDFSQTGFSVRNETGFTYNNQWSLGAGIGLENYNVKSKETVAYSFMPIYGDLRFAFNKQSYNSLFVELSYGYSVRINAPAHNGGDVINPRIGYKFLLTPKLKMVSFAGYVKQNIKKNSDIYDVNPKITSINFGIGIEL